MRLGLIAGNGRFPFLVLDAARAQGHEVTIVAAKEEAFPELDDAATRHKVPIHWISLGQLGRCLELLQSAKVTHVVMAGQVKHTKIFSGGIVPDGVFLKVLARLASKNTDGLIGAVADELRSHGIDVMDSTALLQSLLAPSGVLTERTLTADEIKDLSFGYRMADSLAGLDIGQTIAVKSRAVVAVEGMEGTDEVIGRAGRLAGPGVCIIKVAKPAQDMRFDVPVIGSATIVAMESVGATVLSVDAGRALMFDGDAIIAAANAADITVVGREQDGP
jgi:hypothetical protein